MTKPITAAPTRWRRFVCFVRGCSCRTLSTDGGIGGQCVRCGRIYGWVTRDELRAFADRSIP